MQQLKPNRIYRGNMFLVESGDNIGNNWTMAFSTGNSQEDNNDYVVHSVATNHLHGDEIPEEVIDAKDMADLIAKLLNFYFMGMLFVGNPDQLELFKRNLDNE